MKKKPNILLVPIKVSCEIKVIRREIQLSDSVRHFSFQYLRVELYRSRHENAVRVAQSVIYINPELHVRLLHIL